MKILFIYPSSGTFEIASKKMLSTGAYLPPLGILYLAKMLELSGHHVEIIDCTAEAINNDDIKKAVLSNDVVGLTVYSEQRELENSIKISKIIREADLQIPLILGGPHCSLYPEKSLIQHKADICVTGPGEFVITPIIEALEGKRKLSTIPGIYFKKNNKIIKSEPLKWIDDLDLLPIPARHLVDKYKYGYMCGVKIAKGKVASISASRGCPHQCRFCGLHKHLPKYQERSVDNINKEIDEIIKNGYQTLVFVDDNFLFKKKKVEKIMDFIIKKQENINIWIMGARADSTDKLLYEKMRSAGVNFISFGIESGNQDVLDYYNKKLTISQIKDAVNLSNKMGFFVMATFILGAPIETKEHIQNTIKFAKSIPLNGAIFYPFGYVYGSSIWCEAVEDGKIKPEEGTIYADPNRGLGNFTSDELINFTMKAHKSFYLNPRLWKNEITNALIKKDISKINLGMRMLID